MGDRVVAVFVANRQYLDCFYQCCHELIAYGKFHGDIVLVIGNDLTLEEMGRVPFLQEQKVRVVQFPEIVFPPHVLRVVQSLRTGDDRHLTKRFQFHKIHLFRTFFRQWDYVFYLDSNFHIRLDVQPLLDQRAPYTLVAPDDDYPRFQVVLRDQFDTTSEVFPPLEQGYDMGCRYFQTGLMLFDTRLITDSTFWEIENLILRHPCCMTNEQGFLSLYFASIQKCWKPLVMENGVSYYYGFSMRDRSVPCILYKGTL